MSFLQKGNESAFNELYDRYANRILFFMFKMLQQDEARAQDFTQDVFLKIIEAAHQFDTNKNFKTWIFTIASNHCKNHFRSTHYQTLEFEKYDLKETIEEEPEYDRELIMKFLQEGINQLNSPFKETLLLRYKEELKIREIAEIMEVPIGTIKSRLNQAIGVLSKKLSFILE